MDNLNNGKGLWGAIYHQDLRLVIFDLDGTIYNLKKLRKRMLKQLFKHYFSRPWRFWDLYILWQYRKQREGLVGQKGYILEETPVLLTAKKTWASPSYIHTLCEKWLIKQPLPYLKQYIYPEIRDVFKALRQKKIPIAVYSDYPATEKLAALGLEADLVISSSDPIINQLKPGPKGVLYLLDHFHVKPFQTVYIGDLIAKDGACAQACGVPFVKIPEAFSA